MVVMGDCRLWERVVATDGAKLVSPTYNERIIGVPAPI
jgi:hypothetical protein